MFGKLENNKRIISIMISNLIIKIEYEEFDYLKYKKRILIMNLKNEVNTYSCLITSLLISFLIFSKSLKCSSFSLFVIVYDIMNQSLQCFFSEMVLTSHSIPSCKPKKIFEHQQNQISLPSLVMAEQA
jgi:hypothetical protein